MPHMGHETGAGAYPSVGEHSARMLMKPIPLESLFNWLSIHCLMLGIWHHFLWFSVAWSCTFGKACCEILGGWPLLTTRPISKHAEHSRHTLYNCKNMHWPIHHSMHVWLCSRVHAAVEWWIITDDEVFIPHHQPNASTYPSTLDFFHTSSAKGYQHVIPKGMVELKGSCWEARKKKQAGRQM
jgi:hypothetical protein